MEAERKTTARRGTETRRHQRRITFRVPDAEGDELIAGAELAGCSLGSYIRSRLFAESAMRARRRPTIEVMAITRLQGQMNKIGGNIYQLLRHVNFGGLPEADEIRAAFAGYREVIAAILAALGRAPGGGDR